MTRAPLVAVVGATGTGKTDISVALALALGQRGRQAEIINADAMQLYRGMDIGTAKVTVEERQGIPHHLLDACDVTDEASVAWYQSTARATVRQVWDRGALPLVVGGSGLYVSSVLYDLDFPGRDSAVRARLEAEAEEVGASAMFEQLQWRAPEAATLIDPKNLRRVIRALEVLEVGGDASGLGHLDGQSHLWTEDTFIATCVTKRDVLVARLDSRVERMWQDGLVEEVSGLLAAGIERGLTARRAIGYAQALAQLAGHMTPDEAMAETQLLTRRLARRQVSWFARYAADAMVDTSAGFAPTLNGGPELSVPQVADRLADAIVGNTAP